MWKRKKKRQIKNLYDPELVEEIEVWNAHWTAPEYGDFYRWDEATRRFVQAWKPPKAVESRVQHLERGLVLNNVHEVGTFERGGVLIPSTIKRMINADRELHQQVEDLKRDSIQLLKNAQRSEQRPKVSISPGGQSDHRSIETMVLNARKGTDTRPLEELKPWYGWEREFNVQLGTNEYIHVNGVRISVQNVQSKINSRFGKMYLRVDGKFGMITANLLWSLENNLHM